MKINLILDRLIVYFQVDTFAALAKKLGISASALSNWKNRDTIDFELLLTKCEGISLNWLFLGIGKMHLNDYDYTIGETTILKEEDPGYYKAIITAKEETIITQKKYIEFLERELKQERNEQPGNIGQKRKAG